MIWMTFQGEMRLWILRRRRTKSHKSVIYPNFWRLGMRSHAKVPQSGLIVLLLALRSEISGQGATSWLKSLLLAPRHEISLQGATEWLNFLNFDA